MRESFSDIKFFCLHLIRKYGRPDRISEEVKANQFRRMYLQGFPLDLETLVAIACCCGLNLDSRVRMPGNVRGFHEIVDGKRNIYFKKGDTISGIQNTILHEIREIMESTFAKIYPAHEPLEDAALEIAANQFAVAVLLPGESYLRKAYETGLDVVGFAELYSKSCSQVLLRLGEVMRGKLFLYGALYEPEIKDRASLRVTYWNGSSKENIPEANVCWLNGFYPRKGSKVAPGSLVDRVIRECTPFMAERITLIAGGNTPEVGEEGLVAIATPQIIHGRPSKVALLILMTRDRDILKPQIERIKPIVVGPFHRHL